MKHRRPAPRHPPATPPADPEAFVRRAGGFSRLAVDACSLIVLAEIGVLDEAAKTWRLHTVPAVAAEAGSIAQGLTLLPAEPGAAVNNDLALLQSALRAGLPLLSEDRKVLIAAEEADLDCFDTLVALELMVAAGTLTPERRLAARNQLLLRNAYSPYRLVWAEAVANAAAKFIQ